MPREKLTDRKIKSLKPADPGERYEILDAFMPNLIVRVTDKGCVSFALKSRFPGSQHPTRRALGRYPAMTLEQARSMAREWHFMLRKGIDPRHAQAEARREAEQQAAHTFGNVAEEFIGHINRNRQRKAAVVARELRKEFVSRWADRPIATITPRDIAEVIDSIVNRGSPYAAHNHLGHVRRLSNWAVGHRRYGLETSPCDRLKPRDLIGPRALRTRILDDNELRAFWRATALMAYPWTPLFRLLLLTAQRKSEIGDARRSELDIERALLTIPASRAKSDRPQLVPLAPAAVEIFKSLPEFTTGDCLFSCAYGIKPVTGFGRAKMKLDAIMLAELRTMAAERRDDPAKITLAPWVLHDLRRTARTHLSALAVADIVRELCIGHAKPGLHRVYDQHSFLEEKREAFELWAKRLRSIVEPLRSNVVELAARG